MSGELEVGAVVGERYVIDGVIGEGGMATVYRARHIAVKRSVALKVMHPHLASDPELRERLKREARSSTMLSHPNIVEVYEYGETASGLPFLVMELLDGDPLNKQIKRGAMPPVEVVPIGVQIAHGLSRAHDMGVIHRDVKPENIFLVKDEGGQAQVKLLDFGLAIAEEFAELTAAGALLGSVQYFSPERISGSGATPSSDLYAFGTVLYEMVTGRLPFDAGNMTEYLMKHLTEEPPSVRELAPECPEALAALIHQMLAKLPEERPLDAHQVADKLQGMLRSAAPRSRPSRPPPAVLRLDALFMQHWLERAAIFDEMLYQVYGEEPPYELLEALAELRGVVGRIEALRDAAQNAQEALNAVEQQSHEERARLGAALDALGPKLSSEREAVRVAETRVREQGEALRQAAEAFHAQQRALAETAGVEGTDQPSPDLMPMLAELHQSAQRWETTHEIWLKTRARLKSYRSAARGYSERVEEIRQAMRALEADQARRTQGLDESRAKNAAEHQRLQERLKQLARQITEPMRGRRELRHLFRKLAHTRSENSGPHPLPPHRSRG